MYGYKDNFVLILLGTCGTITLTLSHSLSTIYWFSLGYTRLELHVSNYVKQSSKINLSSADI